MQNLPPLTLLPLITSLSPSHLTHKSVSLRNLMPHWARSLAWTLLRPQPLSPWLTFSKICLPPALCSPKAQRPRLQRQLWCHPTAGWEDDPDILFHYLSNALLWREEQETAEDLSSRGGGRCFIGPSHWPLITWKRKSDLLNFVPVKAPTASAPRNTPSPLFVIMLLIDRSAMTPNIMSLKLCVKLEWVHTCVLY